MKKFDFNNIIGNEQLVKSLKYMAFNNPLHAYIFTGEKFLGKKFIANIFAKSLVCLDEKNKPCNICVSCVTFNSENNPDIFYVKGSKESSITISDIRSQVIEKINIKQYSYKYKIFIIDKADTMTVQAQNALLKTLEEPPSYAIFILISKNLDSILSTVKSRCIIFNIKKLSVSKIKNYLISKYNTEETLASEIANFSRGNLGFAIDLYLNKEYLDTISTIIDIIDLTINSEIFNIIHISKDLEKLKDTLDLMDVFYFWFKDLIVYKLFEDEDKILHKSNFLKIQLHCSMYTEKGIIKCLDDIYLAKKYISQNANYGTVLQMLLIEIKENLHL